MMIGNHLVSLIEKVYAIAFLISCVMAVGLFGYWYFLQNDKIITNIQPYTIVNDGNPVVKAGSTVYLEREYCLNTKEYVGKVYRQYSNHIIYQVPTTTTLNTQRLKGCSSRRIAIEIPANLPTDTYIYEVRIVYRINPIKQVTYHMPPVKLKVINEFQSKIKELINKEE